MTTMTADIDENFPAELPPAGKEKTHFSLRCTVVTPEATVLDEPAAFVALPLYDGELGVAPGRSPLIGRLGYGELRIKGANDVRRYFVDGGFAQVRDDVVTVLTSRSIAAERIDVESARAELAAAKARRAASDAELADREKAEARARALLRVAGVRASGG